MQFEELTLKEFPENSTIGIFGKNEYGKSTIADAISFSLFGEIPRANIEGHKRDFSRSDYVRWGASSSEVELVFESEGKSYEVSRKLTSSGTHKAKLEDHHTGENLANKVRPVNDYIQENILGFGFQEFRYSSYVAQKEIDLIYQKSGEVRSVINNMLGVDLLDDAYTQCYKEFKKIEDDILPEKEKQKDILKKDLDEFQEDREEAKGEKEKLELLEKKIEKKQEEEEKLKKEKQELEEEKEIFQKRDNLSSILEEKRDKRDDLQDRLEEARKAEEEFEKITKRLEDEEEKKKLQREKNLKELKDLINEKEKIENSIESTKDNLEQLYSQKEDISEKEKKLEKTKDFLEEHESIEEKVDSLETINDAFDQIIKIRTEFKEKLSEINETLPELESKKSKKKKDLDAIDEGVLEKKISDIEKLETQKSEKVDEKASATSRRNIFGLSTGILLSISAVLFIFSQLIIGSLSLLAMIVLGYLTLRYHKESKSLEGELTDLRKKISESKERKGRLKQKKDDYDEIKKDLREVKQEIDSLTKNKEKISKTLKSIEDIEVMKVDDFIANKTPRLHEEITGKIDRLNQTPLFDFGKLKFEDVEKVLQEKQKILKKNQKKSGQIEDLRKDVKKKSELDDSIKEKEKKLDELKEEFRKHRSEIENLVSKLELDKVEDLEESIEEKLEEIEKLKDERSTQKGKMDELKEKKDKIPEIKDELEKIQEEINKKEDELDDLPEIESFDVDRKEEVEEKLEELREELDQLQNEKGELGGTIEEKWGKDEELKQKKENYEDLKSEIEELEKEIKYYRDLRSKFKDLQESIRKEIAPQLEQYFSWILPRITENRYKIVRVEDDFGIRVFSEENGDFVELVQLSGGTRDQMLMSLRMGFARALTTAHSKEKQFIFLDEPFSSFDTDRRKSFIDFIKNFEEAFQQLFLISHIEGLEDHVDEFIRIRKDSEGLPYVTTSWTD